MSDGTTTSQPGISPAGFSRGESWGEWLDRHSRTFFIAPAITLVLLFAIFPTFYTIVFAISHVRFTATGLKFRTVWFENFAAQFIGNQQVHFLGRFTSMSIAGWVFSLVTAGALLWWLYRAVVKGATWGGLRGRYTSAARRTSVAE